jgi:hypothetical protein
MPLEFSGVSELARTFGVIPGELKSALKPAVLKAANLIGDKAEGNAGFSSYIPGAVSVSASFSGSGGGAVVKVAERGYPHAGEVRTYEGNGVSPTPFRHPVYGNTNAWVTAMTHPFLGPAVEEEREPAIGIIAEAVAAVARANGF